MEIINISDKAAFDQLVKESTNRSWLTLGDLVWSL